MTPHTPFGKGGNNSSARELSQLTTLLHEQEQMKARAEHEIEVQESEMRDLQRKIRSAEDSVASIEKKIAYNSQLLASAPALSDVIRVRRKLEADMESVKKELRFVEMKAQEAQNAWNSEQNDRAMKENVIQNKRFMLNQMNQAVNPGAYQSAEAEIRRLESDLVRSQSGNRRGQDEAKRFEARLFDLQMQMKQLKQKQREVEQDEVVARRLEGFASENQRLQNDAHNAQNEGAKYAEDLKKVERSVTKLEERLRQVVGSIASTEREISRIK